MRPSRAAKSKASEAITRQAEELLRPPADIYEKAYERTRVKSKRTQDEINEWVPPQKSDSSRSLTLRVPVPPKDKEEASEVPYLQAPPKDSEAQSKNKLYVSSITAAPRIKKVVAYNVPNLLKMASISPSEIVLKIDTGTPIAKIELLTNGLINPVVQQPSSLREGFKGYAFGMELITNNAHDRSKYIFVPGNTLIQLLEKVLVIFSGGRKRIFTLRDNSTFFDICQFGNWLFYSAQSGLFLRKMSDMVELQLSDKYYTKLACKGKDTDRVYIAVYAPNQNEIKVCKYAFNQFKIVSKINILDGEKVDLIDLSPDGKFVAYQTNPTTFKIWTETEETLQEIRSKHNLIYLKVFGRNTVIAGYRTTDPNDESIVVYTFGPQVFQTRIETTYDELKSAAIPLIRFYRNLFKKLPTPIKLQMLSEFGELAVLEAASNKRKNVLPVSDRCMIVAAIGFFLDDWYRSNTKTFPENVFAIAKSAYPDITYDKFTQLMKDLAKYSCDEEFNRAVQFDLSAIAERSAESRSKFRQQELDMAREQEEALIRQERQLQMQADEELARRVAAEWGQN